MSLYLRLYQLPKARVRAQYRFSLLDAAGKPAYELPADTGVFRCPGRKPPRSNQPGGYCEPDDEPEFPACGHEEFIKWEELERRRDSLLAGDRLAVRCDVAVVQVEPVHVAPMEQNYVSRHRRFHVHDYYDEEEEEEAAACTRDINWRSHRQQPMDDGEYVRRCLGNNSGRA
ncbi:hypothetical protein QOZ80_8AG0617760 [Eleusine coracana subsp. coracana]|nr:hypothetical protein QOZ80_8AG0617760 [Eleusine coracana subsp. coracana]